jgi:threonine/homoserine/homoserine lactone efflux protein
MLASLVSMSLFTLIGAITPGPVNIIATSSGVRVGFIRTLPHVLGATLSYTLIVALVGKGLYQLLLDKPQVIEILRYAGSTFLLYMAYKIMTSPSETISERPDFTPPSFVDGGLCQILNPKAWLVSMSGISVFALSQPEPDFYVNAFCLISFVLCFVGVGFWAAAGNLIRRYLHKPQQLRLFNRIMGISLIGTIVSILLS